jgi:hypothetical protein
VEEDPIPTDWATYIMVHGFDSPEAEALAAVLQSPEKCHPRWFKEAEIAIRRAGSNRTTLTYEIIRDAVSDWRQYRDADDHS